MKTLPQVKSANVKYSTQISHFHQTSMKLNTFNVKESATLAINQHVQKLRTNGQSVSHFGFGESPFAVHQNITQALADNRQQKSYLPGLGLPELREAIANFQNHHFATQFGAQDIAIGPGSKELIFQVLMLLPGDLLLPSPCWVSYAPQAMLLDKKAINLATDFDNHYKITPEALTHALQQSQSQQRILVLNSPSNPTGQVYSQNELEPLAQLCQQHNIIIISDEIYALVGFNGASPSLASICPERVVVTSGLSKAFSAGGYRLGFAASQNSDLLKKLAIVISETFSCVSSPIQYAALSAYQNDTQVMDYVGDCTSIHNIVLHYSANRFREMGLRCLDAHGGFYLFPDFSPYQQPLAERGIHSSTQLTKVLLNEAGVAMLPGEDFGCTADTLAVRTAMVDYQGPAVFEQFTTLRSNTFSEQIEQQIPNISTGLTRLADWLKNNI